MITVLTLLSLACITAYTLSVCLKFRGIPASISASFYSLQHKYWFRFTMWLTPMLLMPAILEISDTNTQWLAYLACVGMIVVGCFPDYTGDKFCYRGHVAGAVITMASSQVWVGMHSPYMLWVWVAWACAILAYVLFQLRRERTAKGTFMQAKPLFFIEIICILVVYITVLTN